MLCNICGNTMENNKCPKCSTTMHTNTVIVLGGKNKHYEECPKCNYKGKVK